jgi:2-polyprenyl-3-methyl-5-hydroxy-6-metoxy-1,4-benzoquinol methylase
LHGANPVSAAGESDDPLEAALVRAGWLLIDAHERLSVAEAGIVFKNEITAWREYGESSEPHPNRESMDGVLAEVEGEITGLRYRRMLDFVEAGDRVFDVGTGEGFLARLLLSDGRTDRYGGIDLLQKNVDATYKIIEAGGFERSRVVVEKCDLYDLTRDQLSEANASLVLCCEVLEHVPDAERALRVLAETLPDGADLLFSVPLFRRLEAVFGHVSVFDASRLQTMLNDAGLIVHHVEPVANTWTVVVASRSTEPSSRVAAAARRAPDRQFMSLSRYRDFEKLTPSTEEPYAVRAESELVLGRHGRMHCRVTADSHGGRRRWHYGGVAFPVKGLTSLRLELGLLEVSQVRRVYVDAYAGPRLLGRWTWRPRTDQASGQGYRRFALRPNEYRPPFAGGAFETLDGVDRVTVFVALEPGQTAEFTVRGAYLP